MLKDLFAVIGALATFGGFIIFLAYISTRRSRNL